MDLGGSDKSDTFFPSASCGSAPTSWHSARNKISSVVVLCMENRSFDHYFGAMSLPESMGGLGMTDVRGLTGNESNASMLGNGDIGVHRLEDFTPHDLPHHWDRMHDMWNGGRMDGFVHATEQWALDAPDKLQKNIDDMGLKMTPAELAHKMSLETMGYHTPDQIPMFYQLAAQSSLCQQWYSSVMGPTWTNRFYLHGATAEGLKDNIALGSVGPLFDLAFGWESIMDIMEKRNGFESMNFYHDLSWLRLTNPSIGRELRRQFKRVVHKRDQNRPTGFFARARANSLPPLTVLDPHFGIFRGEDANDDHPDPGGADLHDVRKGQALISTVVAALSENRDQWDRTLLLITYDEAGGFYDHVVPPTTHDVRPEFAQMGFRVPSLAVGPYVRPGCVVDTVLEHNSINRTIEQLFGQVETANGFEFEKRFKDPDVRARIDATNDVLSCLDADALEGRPHPPPVLDPVEINFRRWKHEIPKVTTHEDMLEDARKLPQDEQDEAKEPILDAVMEIGEGLGAVKII